MIARWLAYNKTTEANEYIDVPLLDNISLSVNIAKFEVSSITVVYDDFLNYELPFAWQEIQLVEDEEVKYIFYFKSLIAPKFETNNEIIKLQLSLYSTRDLLAHRIRTVSTYGKLSDIVETIISEVLTDDGYTVVSNLLLNTYIQASYIHQSIESILNDLGNAYEFVWYTDGLKNIYFVPIDRLMDNTATFEIDGVQKDNYGFQLQPILSSTDYGNVIALKNIMMVSTATWFKSHYEVKTDDELSFPRDIWATADAWNKADSARYILYLHGTTDYTVTIVDDEIVLPSAFGYADVETSATTKTWLITRDTTNNNLWQSIKYIGTAFYSLGSIITDTALVPSSYTYYDVEEIQKIAPFTNTSGRIQKSIDLYNKYLGLDDTLAIAKGNLTKANNITSGIDITMEVLDKTKDYPIIKLADVIGVTLGGKLGSLIGSQYYVVTDFTIKERYKRLTYNITAKNVNYNSTYIDLFRTEKIQDNEEQLTNQVSVLTKDNTIENISVTVNEVDIYES